MDLEAIAENTNDGKIVTDIYSGNSKCKCGNNLKLDELNFSGFGTSLSCSCGNRFWFAEDDYNLNELLVYEGYDCVIDSHFVIVKQRVFSEINWSKKKLIKGKLREENDYLYIDFQSKVFAYFDEQGKRIKDGGQLFFKNISVDDMHNISKWIYLHCNKSSITPNYGAILGSLTSHYNIVDYEKLLKRVLDEYYIECLVKEGLAYLFDYNFLLSSKSLEKHIIIDKHATTSSKMLGIPKKVISYLRDNNVKTSVLLSLQNFFKENTYYDFQTLILNKNSVFEVTDLNQLITLLSYGYSAYKLNNYAREIMNGEGLSKSSFLTCLINCVRISRTGGLKFKLYAKRLKERHDELVSQV